MLGTPNVYYIWYGNWVNGPASDGSDSATTVNLLDEFILPSGAGGLSGSAYEHINTTYSSTNTGSTQNVSGFMSRAGSTNVTTYPPGGSTYSTALSDADIQTIVSNTISGGQLPADTNGIYFVLTSSDVNETSGFCSSYCGWHTNGTINGEDIKYSFVGNPARCPSACEAQTISPNNDAGGDGMANIIAHESEETISDEDLNAWYDVLGQENADKCAWKFGTEQTAANGSQYNTTLNTSGSNTPGPHQWLIQENWVNANGGSCAMSF